MTWPPKGPLGKLVLHQARNGGTKRVEGKLHVRAVFEEERQTKILVAHWLPYALRWIHEVLEEWHLKQGFVWAYGSPPEDIRAMIAEDVNK